jgi:hypothetical protein
MTHAFRNGPGIPMPRLDRAGLERLIESCQKPAEEEPFPLIWLYQGTLEAFLNDLRKQGIEVIQDDRGVLVNGIAVYHRPDLGYVWVTREDVLARVCRQMLRKIDWPVMFEPDPDVPADPDDHAQE